MLGHMYHEARAQAKKVKEAQEDNKRRAERRAELAHVQADHPLNILSLDGRNCKLHKSQEQYQATEAMEGLIALNGNPEDKVDRFDGRLLLDFVAKEPETRTRERPRGEDERRLEELLAFERYRDVAQLQALGFSEQRGLQLAAAESIEIRATQRAAAAAALASAAPPPSGRHQWQQPSQLPAGQGAFSAVGFSYGGSEAGGGGASSSSSDAGDSDDDAEAGGTGVDADEAQLEAEEEKLDTLAIGFGIEDFSYRLHKATKQEGETLALSLRPARSRLSRKKANQRSRRMQGQGLDAPKYVARGTADQRGPSTSGRDVWPDPGASRRRSSPGPRSDHRRSGRSRSHSRSRSPHRARDECPRAERTEFITEFSAKPSARDAPHGGAGRAGSARVSLGGHSSASVPSFDRNAFKQDDQGILEAFPDRPDPAAVGHQPIPVDKASLQGIKPHEWRSEREKARERERERDFSQLERERQRDGERGRDRDRSHHDGRDGGSHASTSAQARSAGGTAAAGGGKETPQERLKRIMQAQINKQVQKDNVVAVQKKVQVGEGRTVHAAAADRWMGAKAALTADRKWMARRH